MKKTLIALTMAMPLVIAGQAFAEGHHGGPPRGEEKFAEMDLNGDGVITRSEMDQQRQKKFKEADANGDGFLSLDEVIAAQKQKAGNDEGDDDQGFRHHDMAGHMFGRMDIDGDGLISLDETVVMSDRHFKDMDANLDGKVTLLEAKAAMKDHRHDWKAMRPKGRN